MIGSSASSAPNMCAIRPPSHAPDSDGKTRRSMVAAAVSRTLDFRNVSFVNRAGLPGSGDLSASALVECLVIFDA